MIVVADTSVLINLCRVEQAELLRKLFRQVCIPPEVGVEFVKLASRSLRFQGLVLPSWINQKSVPSHPSISLSSKLHVGEMAALSLAIEIRADAILIDERSAHIIAQQLGLNTIGVLGILLEAKSRGFLVSIRPVLERLEIEANFWVQPALRKRVLESAGE